MNEDARRHLWKLIEETDWKWLVRRSLAIAAVKLAVYNLEFAPRRKTAAQYVVESIFEVLDEEHDPHGAPNLFRVVAAVVASKIDTDAKLQRGPGKR